MIGLIVAMESEFRLVEALLEAKKEEYFRGIRFLCGKVGEREVVLMHSGIGKVCAAAGTVELIDRYAPECVLNTGVAGGIDASLQVMDVVVGSEVVYHDVWCGDGNALGQIQGMPARFVADGRLVQAAMAAEGEVIAQVCHMYGVPFLSCRIISDTPGVVEDNFLQYLDFWTVAPEKSIHVLRQIIERL